MAALNPPASLLAKIGSIVVHTEEGRSSDGHAFDWHAVDALLADPEVKAWIDEMAALSLVPRKRQGA